MVASELDGKLVVVVEMLVEVVMDGVMGWDWWW